MGLLLLMAFAVFRLPPWLPLFAIESNGVDPSWQMVLNEAVSNDWVFGRDLFFTYGPFGFIHTRMYHPGTWAVLIAAWLGISVIIADLVWRVSGHGRLSFVGRTLFGIAMLEFMSRDTMAVCFSLHALVFLEAVGVAQFSRVAATAEMVSFSASRLRAVSIIGTLQIFRLTLSILLLAALPWAKFSYFVTVAFLGCALVAVGTLQKQIPWRAVLLFAACPLAWLMSGATLVECREFIGTGFQLASGYSAAMGLAPESAAGFVILVSSALVVLVLPIWLASRLRLHDWRLSVLAMLFFHGLLFIAWKSCFVRYHAERLPVFLGTVFPLLAYGWLVTGFSKNPSCATGSASADTVETVSSWKHWQSQWHTFLRRMRATEVRWSFPALLATVVVLVSAGLIERVQPGTLDEITNHATAPLRDQVLAVTESVKNPGWRQSTHETQLQKIREANPIPDVDGSVDVFPSKLIVGFAHGLEMRPRPILQSYAAFTPALIERDAQHFRNTKAPDHVLISVGEIDGRLPTLEDSRAWFELLSNYDLTDSSGELLKLSRRKQSSASMSCLVLRAKRSYAQTMTTSYAPAIAMASNASRPGRLVVAPLMPASTCSSTTAQPRRVASARSCVSCVSGSWPRSCVLTLAYRATRLLILHLLTWRAVGSRPSVRRPVYAARERVPHPRGASTRGRRSDGPCRTSRRARAAA